MKGIIFNAVESAVCELLSDDAWDDLLDAAGVDGHYTAIGNYDDVELGRIVAAAAAATGWSSDEVLRAVGRQAYLFLAGRYPELMAGIDSTVTLLHSLNDIIHTEVLKLYPDAKPPTFDLEMLGDDVVRVGYRSDRGLSALAEGLLHGGAHSFGEEIEVTPLTGDGQRTVFDVSIKRTADLHG